MHKIVKVFIPFSALLLMSCTNNGATTNTKITNMRELLIAEALGENKVKETYDLVINYIDKTGTKVADSYVDKLDACDSYMVYSPHVEGKLANRPYLKGIIESNVNVDVVYDTYSTWDGYSVSSKFSGGIGSENDPYLIKTGADLAYLSSESYLNSYDNTYFKLANNLDLGDHFFTPIASSLSFDHSTTTFNGVFDGDNHIISGLNVEFDGAQVALFGSQGGSSIIKNLIIDGTSTALYRNAGLVAYQDSATALIDNVINYVDVKSTGSSNYSYSGGITCFSNGTISNSINYGNVDSEYEVAAGISGYSYGTVKNCINYGQIETNHYYSGGIVARAGANSSTLNNVNYGYTKGTSYVSGIIGNADFTNMNIKGNKNYAPIYGNTFVAGIAGSSKSVIDGNENYGAIKCYVESGDSFTAGIVGRNIASKVINNTNYGMVTGANTQYVGGCVASSYSKGAWIENCVNYGTIHGFKKAAGVAGYQTQDMRNCINYGDVYGTHCLGGVCGHNYSGRLVGLENFGKVIATRGVHSASLEKFIAGVCGHLTDRGSLKDSSNHGYVEGGSNVGGCAGYSGAGTLVENCTNDGEIVGDSNIGEIIGFRNH